MCGQISDMVLLEGLEYLLIGSDPEELFNPQACGIVSQFRSTGCYRGFASSYRISDGVLHLHELGVNSEDGHYPLINGTEAGERKNDPFQDSPVEHAAGRVYRFPDFRLRFTGTIRLGRGFTDIDLGMSRIGFAGETEYLRVLDLDLDRGVVVATSNLSKRISRIRNQQVQINRLREEELLTDAWIEELGINGSIPEAMWMTTAGILREPDPDGLGRKLGELERDLRTPRHFVAVAERIHLDATESARRYPEPQPDFVGIELSNLLTLQEFAVKRVPRHFVDRLGELVANGVPEKGLLAYFLSIVRSAVGLDIRDRLQSDLERIAEEGALVEEARTVVEEMMMGITPEEWPFCNGNGPNSMLE